MTRPLELAEPLSGANNHFQRLAFEPIKNSSRIIRVIDQSLSSDQILDSDGGDSRWIHVGDIPVSGLPRVVFDCFGNTWIQTDRAEWDNWNRN